jgi:hypothetical protein
MGFDVCVAMIATMHAWSTSLAKVIAEASMGLKAALNLTWDIQYCTEDPW